jgi:hypothetical protein
MELHAHKPRVGRDFNHLNQACFRVFTRCDHAVGFEISKVGIVEFVAVAVALRDVVVLVGFGRIGIGLEFSFVST